MSGGTVPPRLAVLARDHDDALFQAAYPPGAAARREAGARLRAIAARVARLSPPERDGLDDPAVSGVAGTAIAMAFGLPMAQWLRARFGRRVRIDWSVFERADEGRLGPALVALCPLLADTASVDANVPFRAFLAGAARSVRTDDLGFLVDGIGALETAPDERERLWSRMGLQLWWDAPRSVSRSFARFPAGRPFVFDGPLLSRRDVSLARTFAGPRLPLRRLSRRDGASALDAARALLAVRYRELHAFDHGDPACVVRAEAGRGVRLWVNGILPSRRLPLRSGFGFVVATNGVPTGYGDAYALADRLDLAFNVFPAFRKGESAFVYARLLRLFRQLLGSTSIHVDPYQIGLGNPEAIASGAFWFYRKLGFRCADGNLETVARREEALLGRDPGRRTPARTLRRLATGGLSWDAPGTEPGRWDRFSIATLAAGSGVDLGGLLRAVAPGAAPLRALATEKAAGDEARFVRLFAGRSDLVDALRRAGSTPYRGRAK